MSNETPTALPWPLPPRKVWKFGRCACCDRPTLVAPGPTIPTDAGLVTLPYCVDGFERGNRYIRRAQLVAAMHDARGMVPGVMELNDRRKVPRPPQGAPEEPETAPEPPACC